MQVSKAVLLFVLCIDHAVTNGRSFYVNIAIVGDISCGKTTLLNAMFGDILGEVKLGKGTGIPQRFFESVDAKDNSDILNTGAKENQAARKNIKQLGMLDISYRLVSWVGYSVSPTFGDKFPSFNVKTSVLVPYQGIIICIT